MIITNYHTHNSLCDGKGEIEEYIEAAIEKKFAAIGFSSHAPLPYDNDWTLQKETLDEYMVRIKEMQKEYRDKIEVYLGLEVDFLAGIMHPRDKWITDLKLDYVIGSVHSLPDKPGSDVFLSIDGPDEEFLSLLNDKYEGSFPKLAGDYYSTLREMIRIGGFDILGHIDLVKKKNKTMKYLDESEPWYRNEIARTLSTLRETGIILEINTGGMSRGATEEPYPSPWILSKAVEAGIPIQLNADAHAPQNIDFYFKESVEMARQTGITSFRVLLNGKWQDVSI